MNNYAKLIDGRLKYAPTTIRTADGLVCNPRPDKLIPLGYKEVIHPIRRSITGRSTQRKMTASGSAGRNTRPIRSRSPIPNSCGRWLIVPRRTNT